MDYSVFRFTLNMHNHRSQASVSACRGDTAIRLCINITDGGNIYKIADGCVAMLSGTKADGNTFWNRCVIENNTIIYDFTEQTASCPGMVRCEVTLYGVDENGAQKLITAPKFSIVVDEREVSGNDVNFSEKEHDIDVIMGAVAAEHGREEAEKAREANEEERQASYNQALETANAAKVMAETAKTNSESAISTSNEAKQISSNAKAVAETVAAALKDTNARVNTSEEDIDILSARTTSAEHEIKRIKDGIEYTNIENFVKLSENVKANTKKITNLEARLPDEDFITDSTTAYQKTVPLNVCPYARVNKIGGYAEWNYEYPNVLPKIPTNNYVTTVGGIKFTPNGDGSVTLKGTNNGLTNSTFAYYDGLMPAGTYYFDNPHSNVSISVTNGGGDITSVVYYQSPFTLYEESRVRFVIKVKNGDETVFNNTIVYPKLLKKTRVAGYKDAKVTKLVGGKTNLLDFSNFREKTVNGVTVSTNGKGAVILNGTPTVQYYFNIYFNVDFPTLASNYYVLNSIDTLPDGVSFCITYGYGFNNCLCNTHKTYKENSFMSTHNDVYNLYITIDPDVTFDNVEIYPVVQNGKTALLELKDLLLIPEEIQAIEGYGQNTPDNPSDYFRSYIDFENMVFTREGYIKDDKWVNAPKSIDISQYFTDPLINIEDCDFIRAVNEHKYDVPSTITYITETVGE